MPHYIALIHKDPDSCYGVSFPDVPGVFTAGGTLDETIAKASEALSFAAEDWEALTGSPFPALRTLDALRADTTFLSASADVAVAAVPFDPDGLRTAAQQAQGSTKIHVQRKSS